MLARRKGRRERVNRQTASLWHETSATPNVRVVLWVFKQALDLAEPVLDVVAAELANLLEHSVTDLGTSERLAGELVVGRTLSMDYRGRGRQDGVGVGIGVLVREAGDGLCVRKGEPSGLADEREMDLRRADEGIRTSLALS